MPNGPTPKSFDRLALEPSGLPASSRRRATRVLPAVSAREADRLARRLRSAGPRPARGICNTLTEQDPCGVCTDPERDASLLCVVEDPGNVAAIEKTREFRGRYHVLWGALSPLKGIGPEEIDTAGLVRRVTPEIKEVILATNERGRGGDSSLYRAAPEPTACGSRACVGLTVGGDIGTPMGDDGAVSGEPREL